MVKFYSRGTLNLYFLKLNNRYLRELEFEFRTRDGEKAKFDHSTDTVSMVLILRPTARGCI